MNKHGVTHHDGQAFRSSSGDAASTPPIVDKRTGISRRAGLPIRMPSTPKNPTAAPRKDYGR